MGLAKVLVMRKSGLQGKVHFYLESIKYLRKYVSKCRVKKGETKES